ISTEKMKDISINTGELTVEAGAGVTLKDLHEALAARGLWYPVDPTEQSATIGGNAATNSWGARSLKYGPIRGFILEMGVVLADGTCVKLRRGVDKTMSCEGMTVIDLSGREFKFPKTDTRTGLPHKNNTGYYLKPGMDIIDLFIGSEGTLGIITEVKLRVLPMPKTVNAMMIFTETFDKACALADSAQKGIFDMVPLSIEYIDGPSVGFLKENGIDAGGAGPAVFIEFEGEVTEAVAAAVEKSGIDPGKVTVSSTREKKNRIYKVREALPERINEYIRSKGMVKISTDFTFPSGKMDEMVHFYENIKERTRVKHLIFGHLGDNNLHVNFLPADELERGEVARLYGNLLKEAVELGGVFASEHGVGKLKKQYLSVQFDTGTIEAMKAVKRAFDPEWKLCPGNIFDRETK
ncbi:MAG: FAD-binding oxidoreductase, partial [Spirochaetia bacterium]|nr:FAD-binding oxidoreductase [Spirochaetia bacterium]